MKSNLQVLTLSLEGGMLNRKKSLQGAKKDFELLVEKTIELQEELSACESKC